MPSENHTENEMIIPPHLSESAARAPYTGRFAPSPTGLLHIGSLLTALASYADARAHGGRWLVRMEDLDPPREMPGAAAHILRTLDDFGFEWDGEVLYQSRRHEVYREALHRLQRDRLVYPCYCSRKDWQAAARSGADGFVYNGLCRRGQDRPSENGKAPAWRIKVPQQRIAFGDRIVGRYEQNLAEDIGDFVLLRADGFWAYQLAVVADDAEQGVTHIVRGQDLLVSTPRQIYLQQCLGFAEPVYAHLPLLLNKHGQKWSKQTLAPALEAAEKERLLREVMAYLNVPSAPQGLSARELLAWTAGHWDMAAVPQQGVVTEK